MFVISDNQSFIFQILTAMRPFREKLDFFSPLRFEIENAFVLKISKIKLYSVRASQRYLVCQ